MLYKYLGPERVDVMHSLSIRFSPLLSLNDPFESLPLVDVSSAKEMLLSKTNSDSEVLWEKTDEDKKTDENFAILKNTRAEAIANIEEKFKASNIGRKLITLLGYKFGVLSLSRTARSILMWSHYAAEGRGFVIGLEESHPFFHQEDARGCLTKPLPVVYTRTRSKIFYGDDHFYEKLLCEKSLEWAYEEEERICRSLENTEARSIRKDLYGQNVVLTQFPKEVIKSVYFGYRADEGLMRSVFQAIDENSIKCNVYRTRICDDEYRIIFDDQLRV